MGNVTLEDAMKDATISSPAARSDVWMVALSAMTAALLVASVLVA